MKRALLILMLVAGAAAARADGIPEYISYQGRVVVQGTNFSGTGLFKFAFVTPDGGTSLWSHDGTSVGGSAPASALSLPVNRGLFYIHLGDTNVAGMTSIPVGVFANQSPRLRVWFSSGGPFDQLTPDHQIAAVPYALLAGQVAGGSVGTNALDASVSERFVDVSGDTMTGLLAVPPDGFRAGTSQFVLNNGYAGIGTTNPGSPLTVVGGTATGSFIFEAFSGTNRVGWARKK